jgi:hypothetical protein
MVLIYISNDGDDEYDGLTVATPVRSWKRVMELCDGNNEMVMMEGRSTIERLEDEIYKAKHPTDSLSL